MPDSVAHTRPATARRISPGSRIPRQASPVIWDIAIVASVLAYCWCCTDTRLIYHCSGPVFYSTAWFVGRFLTYPGGPIQCLYAWMAQFYTSPVLGTLLLAAQIASAAILTGTYLRTLARNWCPYSVSCLLSLIPACLLLLQANLYYDRTPLALALALAMAISIVFARLVPSVRSETALAAAFVALLVLIYYAGGIAILFFAPSALVRLARMPRTAGLAYLGAAAALPAAVERFHLAYMPVSAGQWLHFPDGMHAVVYGGLYGFYFVATAALVFLHPRGREVAAAHRREPSHATPSRARWHFASPATAIALVAALGGLMTVCWRSNGLNRRLATIDYLAYREDWPGVIEAARHLTPAQSTPLTRYLTDRALYETGRLGDDLFGFPQATPLFSAPPYPNRPVSFMLHVTDLYLELGRVNDAEHFGSDFMVDSADDPRLYRQMARIYLVTGQTAAARKFLTWLTCNRNFSAWARHYLDRLNGDPELAGDAEIGRLRRRMIRSDDMLPVWQRADMHGMDLERLLVDQLQQDPSNRMAFEFLMSTYLVDNNMKGILGLMPHFREPESSRSTAPRLYQEALAVYADITGANPDMPGVRIEPETFNRLATFKWTVSHAGGGDAAVQAAAAKFGDTFFFHALFGAGGGL
jgi:Family of unknown function (DUF6057)